MGMPFYVFPRWGHIFQVYALLGVFLGRHFFGRFGPSGVLIVFPSPSVVHILDPKWAFMSFLYFLQRYSVSCFPPFLLILAHRRVIDFAGWVVWGVFPMVVVPFSGSFVFGVLFLLSHLVVGFSVFFSGLDVGLCGWVKFAMFLSHR